MMGVVGLSNPSHIGVHVGSEPVETEPFGSISTDVFIEFWISIWGFGTDFQESFLLQRLFEVSPKQKSL